MNNSRKSQLAWGIALFLLTGTPAWAQVRITEYMYSGANGEFIELTNLGGSAVDLTGWSLDDSTNTPGSLSLSALGSVAAGESVVITESAEATFRAAWSLAPTVKILDGSGVVAGLGRNDSIFIYDASSALVDRLDYGDQTFSGSIRTQNASGWICTQGLGANDPFLWVLSVVADAQGSVASTGADVGSPGSFTSVACPSGPTGACCTMGSCADGVTQADCENGGGVYQGDASLCSGVTCPQPSNAPIRITEYMYAGLDGEFLELTNIGMNPVDMAGFSFDDNTNLPGTIDLTSFGTVAPGESVIITEAGEATFRTAWNLDPGIKIISGIAIDAALGRSDTLNIWDGSNSLVDRLQYGDQDFPGTIRTQNSSGWVCDAGLGQNNPHEWFLSFPADIQSSTTSTGGDVGSPGSYTGVDCASGPMVTLTDPPSLISVDALPSVTVTFSAAVSGVVAGNLTVNGSPATSVSGSGAGPYTFSGYAVPIPGNVDINVASGSIVSSPGGVPFLGYGWSLSVGIRIVINELNYHPHDVLHPTQDTEFVEFYNAGASQVDLSGWVISDGVVFTFAPATFLDPASYLVIAVNPTALQAATGHAGALQWTSGALSNGGERVAIRDSFGNLMDEVEYSDGGAWPSQPDGSGPSLELINPNLPNQYAASWRASSGINGTPGAQNSVFNAAPAPIIISPMHTPSIPAPSTPVTVTALVLDDGMSPPNVTLNYRQDAVSPGAYLQTPMLDDGAHGDGAAGDDTYGATLTGLANGEQYDFYITADDGSAVSTFPRNHPTANGSCSAVGCQADQNPTCVLCQTLLCKFSNETLPTDFPVYHIIVSRPNKSTQESLSCNTSPVAFDPCKTEFDATFVDDTGKVYYNVTERYRGQSSITLFPKSYAVDFATDNQLPTPLGFSVRKLILNANQPTRQKLGFDIFRDAGMPASVCEFIRLRFTGINYDTTNIGSIGFNGLYACIERVDGDFLNSQGGAVVPDRGTSSTGNLYRGENTANFDWRGTAPGPYRVNLWGRNGYSKENNEELDDFTDVINLCDVLNNTPAGSYVATVAGAVDEDEWCRYFALHNILSNKEGGIYRDTGDDYYLFMNEAGHVDGPDAKFITWDTDSVFRDAYETIWRTGNNNNTIAAVRNFLRHNAFAPIYVKDINDLLATNLSIANFNARIDTMPNAAFFTSGGSAALPATRQQFKDWFAGRVTSINNETIDALTLTGIPVSPYTNANPILALSGQLNQAGTHNVTVNGVQATFSVYQGNWSYNYNLYPGLNTITVKSFDRQAQETASITSTVLYDPPPATPGLRLTAPTRMVDSKTLTLRADILDSSGNIDWRTCTQLGTVSATRLSDGSPVPTSITIFETLNGGAGGGTPPADSIRFYNGVGSVSITLDQGAGTPPGDILITVTVGPMIVSKIVNVLDGDNPALFRNLSGTLTGAGLLWGPSDGVIHLTGTVTVNSGNTLTILPGTLIMVDAGPVNDGTAIIPTGGGQISAPGSRAEPIYFFATNGPSAMVLPQNAQNNSPSWRGIYHQGNGNSTYSFVFFTGAGNGIVSSHPRPPIIRAENSHILTFNDCIVADCPGMGTSALGGSSGTYTFRRCLFSRVGIGGEWLGSGLTLLIEDSWFTRIGRAPEPNGVDGDILHLDRPGNSYIIRRSVLTDCGDDMIDHSTGAQPVVENCLLYDCRDKVVSIGPLVNGPEATITMTNCLIFNGPGGLRCNQAPAILTNCTLGAGTNVNGQGCTGTSIQRCILWTNSANTCCGDVDYTIVGNAGHLECGTGNLSTDPLFVNTTCNYELQAGSPALTAGPSGDRIGWLGFPVPLNGCIDNGDCDDGDPCTTDFCNNGICEYTSVPGCCHMDADCDDGSLCTVDACVNNVCSNTPTDCSDGDACTTDTCNPLTGCEHAAANCDDGNPCTVDSCDPMLGCQNIPINCPKGHTCNQTNGQCEILPITVVFQNGLNGYADTQDTYFQESVPTAINGDLETIRWDTSSGSPAGPVYMVVRFDNIFGTGPGQIPTTATIQSATLTYTIGGDANATGNDGDLREVLVNWDEATTTYNNFGGTAGVQAGDHTGTSLAVMPGSPLGAKNIDVTSSLATWLAAPATNLGWIVLPISTDGVQVRSSEFVATPVDRPTLSVTFLPISCANDGDCDDLDPCTIDACVNDACENTPINCDDMDPCTSDVCNGGICDNTPIIGCCEVDGECDDGSVCTTDSCVNNICQNTPINCDDGDACTEDTCDPINGCQYAVTSCDDGVDCTDDSCDPMLGCQNVSNCPMGLTCNTGNGQCESQPVMLMFQDGVSGYDATVDTFIHAGSPTANNAAATVLVCDGAMPAAADDRQVLLRFDSIFGDNIDQIPLGSTIQSASLTVMITNASLTGASLHRMTQAWLDTNNWNTFNVNGDGIQPGTECEAAADVSSFLNATSSHSIDVTASLVAWSAGQTNNGWVWINNGDDSWQFNSSEFGTVGSRPKLSVTFLPPTGCMNAGDCDDGNPCTDDACNMGMCEYTNNSAACDDGLFCNGLETCDPQLGCVADQPCQPGEQCDEAADLCRQPLMSCQITDPMPSAGGSTRLEVFLSDVLSVLGYETEISIVRTSGTGTVTVGFTGGVAVDDDRPDFIFFGVPDVFPAANCAAKTAAAARLSGGTSVTSAPAYLSEYALTVSPDASPGSTFEISIVPSPGADLTNPNGQPIPFQVAPACVLTVVGGCAAPACLTVQITIPGLAAGPVDRDVECTLTRCGSSPVTVTETVLFTPNAGNGIGALTLTNVDPLTTWVSVREGHTLSRLAAVDFSGDNEDTVSVSLVSGDLQTAVMPQDDIVDILDFAILSSRFNTTVTDCVTGDPEDCSLGADVTGDGDQDTVDFTALQIYFFQVSDPQDACPAFAPPGKPGREPLAQDDLKSTSNKAPPLAIPRGLGRIGTSRLRAMDASLVSADENGDGIVDAGDIREFFRQHGIAILPAFELKLRSMEAAENSLQQDSR